MDVLSWDVFGLLSLTHYHLMTFEVVRRRRLISVVTT